MKKIIRFSLTADATPRISIPENHPIAGKVLQEYLESDPIVNDWAPIAMVSKAQRKQVAQPLPTRPKAPLQIHMDAPMVHNMLALLKDSGALTKHFPGVKFAHTMDGGSLIVTVKGNRAARPFFQKTWQTVPPIYTYS